MPFPVTYPTENIPAFATKNVEFMPASKVLSFSEKTSTMTYAQGLAFIERTRRQLDRFDALPHATGKTIPSEDEAAIRQICDEVEAYIHRSLSNA
jgi:hypothetical protein